MCRLFGLLANKEVGVEFSFLRADKPWRSLGKSNPHGWGIGYYDNGKAMLFKQPISAADDQEFSNKAKNVRSKILISHVRRSTQGVKKEENTHPFVYGDWIFAHNGNIDIKEKIKTKLFDDFKNDIKGDTDSEVFFYWLLQNINEANIIEGIKKSIEYIEENKGHNTSSLNFLLTNGKQLYAFRQAFISEDYYSLFYLVRDPGKNKFQDFISNDTKQLIRSKMLKDEKAILICSEKLTTDEKWRLIPNGTLFVVNEDLSKQHKRLIK